MNGAEQDQVIGQVVRQLSEAKKKLACLEAKSEGVALNLGLLCNWLRGQFPSGVALPEDLSIADAIALVTEVKETKAHIRQLEERRSRMGV